jgi:hypothetical protein
VTVAYVCRILPLACLAADIMEAHPRRAAAEGAEADRAAGSMGWEEQRRYWLRSGAHLRLADTQEAGCFWCTYTTAEQWVG